MNTALIRVLSSAVACLAVLAPCATAAARPTRLQRAEAIADSYYPNSPCHGRVVVVPVAVSRLDALWPDLATGMVAYVSDCRVEVAWSVWDGAPWRQVCRGLVHEYGHLAGLGHSPDPASVMHAPLYDIAQGSERCWRAFYDREGAMYSQRDLARARARAFLARHPGWKSSRRLAHFM